MTTCSVLPPTRPPMTIVDEHVSHEEIQQAQQPPRMDNTVFVFDWDDTLLASSWLAAEGLRLDYPAEVPAEAVAQLRVLEASVIKVLTRALQLGRDVHLVTNAETGWVELSAQRFMPGVFPLLRKLKIISARSTYERMHPDAPNQWKVEAFRRQIAMSFEDRMDLELGPVADPKAMPPPAQGPPSEALNIMSFGDSIHEREALHAVTGPMPNCLKKSVKFVERPTMEQLQRQLELVYSCLDYICSYGGDLDLMLTIQLLYN